MMFYLIYFAIIMIIPLYAQSRVRSAYSKYS
ncbi:zinc metallopeptidase, partial [Bacillus sp. OA1]|nr:zinc metallopeptidase [Bacillus sp. OA1]